MMQMMMMMMMMMMMTMMVLNRGGQNCFMCGWEADDRNQKITMILMEVYISSLSSLFAMCSSFFKTTKQVPGHT